MEFVLSVEEAIVLSLLELTSKLGSLGVAIARMGGLTAQQWLVRLQVAGNWALPAIEPDRRCTNRTVVADREIGRRTELRRSLHGCLEPLAFLAESGNRRQGHVREAAGGDR